MMPTPGLGEGGRVADKESTTPAIKRLRETARLREAAQLIQLPLWPEPKRGTPNSFIRSALFAVLSQ